MIGAVIGMPVGKLSATTNQNDTVPRYMLDKQWTPSATIESLSNAMDVSKPNNWPRVQTMLDNDWFSYDNFYSVSVDEQSTKSVMKKIQQLGYIAEPHTAIAYQGLVENKATDAAGIFLATAHPAKFKESVEEVLNTEIAMPKPLADALAKPCLAIDMHNDYDDLRSELFAKLG
jgi:threonine synthase